MQTQGISGFTSKLGSFTVAATADARQPRDVRGQTLSVRFEISDPSFSIGNSSSGPYDTTVTLRVNSLSLPMIPRMLHLSLVSHALLGGQFFGRTAKRELTNFGDHDPNMV